ncbi:hypothetical protein MF672_004330 [Actinomadura sp. ATCC 31491]|uniref:Serine/threonine protein kinase n=1 Tax=Actinomadura luzonensis TaxID=2805427 RepID=A0ABT0FL34_9ACTN|nr:hypothetical protein [Actinomadura luzonensis]MCK2213026.1 hypothetical protein [Actinomadura luzonensis]
MSRLGPVITLAAGAVLAAGLGVASVNVTPAANTAAGGGTVTEAPAAPEESTPPAESTEPAERNTASPERTEADDKIGKADYGGYVKGNGGLIAISIRSGKAVGYFCDGRAEAWFKGSQSGDSVSLTGVRNGKVTAALGGGKATGQLALGGRKWSFVAAAVRKPSGLYRATALVRGAQYRAGWIRLKNPDGSYTSVGAAVEGDNPVPVPKLNADEPTAPLTVDGTTIYPKDVDGFIQEMS